MNNEEIARIAHQVNKAYCESLGDNSQKDWEDAEEWQRQSAINGVKFHLENTNTTPEESHNCWLEEKKKEGWKYGGIKDPQKKEHPCFLPYEDLPQDQKSKDYIFSGVVRALKQHHKGF